MTYPDSIVLFSVLVDFTTGYESSAYLFAVPPVSRQGDTFVTSSIEEAIRNVDSAIESTRRHLFDG